MKVSFELQEHIIAMRKTAHEKTRALFEEMRKTLDENMLRDGYEPYDRKAGGDTLHLSYAMQVLNVAWPDGTPVKLKGDVDDLRFLVRGIISRRTMREYMAAFETESRPSIIADTEHVEDMHAYYAKSTADFARNFEKDKDSLYFEMVRALDAAMDDDKRPATEKRAALLVLPLYYAMHMIEASFPDGQPVDVLPTVVAMRNFVRDTLFRQMCKEYVGNSEDKAWPRVKVPRSRVDAIQQYCSDTVCVVLAEGKAQCSALGK